MILRALAVLSLIVTFLFVLLGAGLVGSTLFASDLAIGAVRAAAGLAAWFIASKVIDSVSHLIERSSRHLFYVTYSVIVNGQVIDESHCFTAHNLAKRSGIEEALREITRSQKNYHQGEFRIVLRDWKMLKDVVND